MKCIFFLQFALKGSKMALAYNGENASTLLPIDPTFPQQSCFIYFLSRNAFLNDGQANMTPNF